MELLESIVKKNKVETSIWKKKGRVSCDSNISKKDL